MPFVRKTGSQGSQPPTDTRKLFIGRTGELLFFVQNILKPEEPTHNIISIWGQGGVGKSTLLARFIDEARSAEFKDYCLTARVDELQPTPASIMEKFAAKLHIQGAFEKALRHYKKTLRTQPTELEMMQDSLIERMPTFAGAAVEGVPFVGPLLGEGAKATAEHFLDKNSSFLKREDVQLLEDPTFALTQAFIDELNQLADTRVLVGSGKVKYKRVILFFDTYEQLASEVAPWLLNYFLPADIKSNIVLVIAGRGSIERSPANDTKRWLPYIDNENIFWIPLNSFTEDETHTYLIKRTITDPDHISTIWQLSQGLPLYLSLLTFNPLGKVDPTADVVANFLRWIPKEEQIKRQLALDAALFSRPFNQDDLAAFTYLPENELLSLYSWLIAQPFVRSQNGRYSYHELAQDLFRRHLYHRSKKEYYSTRRNIANYYLGLLEEAYGEQGSEASNVAEWLELILALVDQLMSLQDTTNHIKAIELLMTTFRHTDAEQNGEMAKFLRELSNEQTGIPHSTDALHTLHYLLRYIEADARSSDRLAASNALLQIVEQSPSFSAEARVQIYSDRGWAYLHLKKYQEAISDFNSALQLKPDYAWAYGSRGLVYRALKNYQQAIADFDRAIELNPKYAWAYGSRGLTYHFLRDYRRAIADSDRAIELNPQYIWAYGSRGRSYQALKEYQRAIADFDYVIEHNPLHAWAYEQRGRVYRKLRNYRLALADFGYIIELDSQYAWAYIHRGITYRMLKDYQQAIADFDYALDLEPHNALIFAQRGFTYLWIGNKEQALRDYIHGWKVDEKFPHNAWMIEWTRMCQESPDESMPQRLEEIAAFDPKHYAAYFCRGVSLWLLGQYEEALALLEQAKHVGPADRKWELYFWKGMTYASLGREEDAIAVIERSLALELPPVLLTPLRWFEQDRPKFYQQYVVPLMSRFDLV
jgi:tetratricopeptide (TPR) repeat protein